MKSMSINSIYKKPVLLCEYAADPFGIDNRYPRFSWKLSCTENLRSQESYQIKVYTEDKPGKKGGLVWDSGKVKSTASTNIRYGGESLFSNSKYIWKVTLWDNAGELIESDNAEFFTAIIGQDTWDADWICAPIVHADSLLVRHKFNISKLVFRAVAYIAGLGYYELYANGVKIGDQVLSNAATGYERTVLYSVFDLTQSLNDGQNVIGAMLGNGWYNQLLSDIDAPVVNLRMSMRLVLEYEDGSCQIIKSGEGDWEVTNEGPIRYNSIYNGETFDARRVNPYWCSADYDNKGREYFQYCWMPAVNIDRPGGVMKAQMLEPIKVVQTLKPISILNPSEGIYVFDFGQNFAGWAQLTVEGYPGDVITLHYGELIYENNTVNAVNSRSAKATDRYILNGKGVEQYSPRFTYHGFRYVQVEGLRKPPESNCLTGCVVRSAVDVKGSFNCDNALLNQIQHNIFWTEQSNLHGFPTDCPQRNERLGWLNDMTVRTECALYNFDLVRLYAKWVGDISDTQGKETGAIADTAPHYRLGNCPADPVTSSYIIIPWQLYLHYGDTDVMEKYFDGLKGWTDYLEKNSTGHIVNYSYYGDWAGPISTANPASMGAGAVSVVTPGRLMSTGYLYLNCLLVSKMAGVLGNVEEEKKYVDLAEKVKEALNEEYLNRNAPNYATNSQASNAFPLYLGIVPGNCVDGVIQSLVNNVVNINSNHVTTGNLCSRYIMEVLSLNGHVDVAYDLMTQTTYPSYGYMIENGATTIWERWERFTDGTYSMASHNHPMYGSVGLWFYRYLAGICADEKAPGFTNVIIKPFIPTKLNHVKAELKTIKGVVASEWTKDKDGGLTLKCTIPWNCTGEVYVPVPKDSALDRITINGKRATPEMGEGGFYKFSVGSGTYIFKI